MKSKEFILDGQLKFSVTKRKSSRHLKISLGGDGSIRVSIPYYVPYSAAITFVKSRQKWIENHRPQIKIYSPNMPLGKSHHLMFILSAGTSKVSGRISGSEARLTYPGTIDPQADEVQRVAKELSIKAYRVQAKALLPIRVEQLADKYGFKYNNLRFRDLKSRWGSCDQQGNITLSVKLMELPWDLIDYVILHELNHTKHLNHGKDFWDNLKQVLPDALEKRKEIKKYRASM